MPTDIHSSKRPARKAPSDHSLISSISFPNQFYQDTPLGAKATPGNVSPHGQAAEWSLYAAAEGVSQIGQNIASSVLGWLGASASSETPAKADQTRISRDPEPAPLAPVIHLHLTPSPSPKRLPRTNPLTCAGGYDVDLETSALSEAYPSNSIVQLSLTINLDSGSIPQPLQLESYGSMHSQSAGLHPGVSRSRCSSQSEKPPAQATVAGQPQDNPKSPRTNGPKKPRRPCAGTNLDGRSCGNKASADATAHLQNGQEWFCPPHRKREQPMAQHPDASRGNQRRRTSSRRSCPDTVPQLEGFKSTQGLDICYDDWILDSPSERVKKISAKTRRDLQARMKKGPSPLDEPGYVYCYQLPDDDNPGYVHLKVGRSINPDCRISEWEKQCGEEVIVKGWLPGLPDATRFHKAMQDQLYDRSAEKGINCHMLEELIHIQLKGHAERWERGTCECGQNHVEIFTFKVNSVRDHDPWKHLVLPVIRCWYDFVNAHT